MHLCRVPLGGEFLWPQHTALAVLSYIRLKLWSDTPVARLQVAQMDADVEPVEVASSADEEEMKHAAQDHLDATVISYVLVSVVCMRSAVCLYSMLSTRCGLVTAAIIHCVCSPRLVTFCRKLGCLSTPSQLVRVFLCLLKCL
jgi:hypothetical protein